MGLGLLAGMLAFGLDGWGALRSRDILYELTVEGGASPVRTRFLDNTYVFPDHTWLTTVYMPYFRNEVMAWRQRQVGELSPALLAVLFKTQLGISNAHGGRADQGEVACAVLRRTQGSDDVAVLVRTERGWFTLDPARGGLQPWAEIAAAGDIRAIEF